MTKVCYIAMPHGKKSDPHGGGIIDFDSVAEGLIMPAASLVGISAERIDEGSTGTLIMKNVLSRLLTSDIVVFDITTSNPNVFYELGIRHALRPSTTIIIRNILQRPPFDLNMLAIHAYSTDESGHAVPDERFIKQLASAFLTGIQSVRSDSPVYEFFPDLEVKHPKLNSKTSETLNQLKVAASNAQLVHDTQAKIEAFRDIEDALKNEQDLDPQEYINLIRKYRLESAWDDVIRVGESAPEQVRSSPEVAGNLALALNRRNAPGDAERAIEVAEKLALQTGWTSESLGILGRIYRDVSLRRQQDGDVAGSRQFLELSIKSFLDGFEREPDNIYLGLNAASLMWMEPSLKKDGTLRKVLEHLRLVINSSMSEAYDREDFWFFSTALEVAVMSGDWNMADKYVLHLRNIPSENWQIQTMINQLGKIAAVSGRKINTARIRDLLTRLQQELAALK